MTSESTSEAPVPVVPANRRRRSVLAGISLVLACIAVLAATLAVWAHQVAFNTDRFTALAAETLDDPEVIDPLAARISGQVIDALDVETRLENLLPDRVTAIAGPVTLALQDGLTRRLETLLAEPRLQQALTRTLSFGHERVMNLLRDRSAIVTVVDGQVVLEVYPVVLVALQELQSAGIIDADRQLPDPTTSEPPGVIRGVLENRLGVTLPDDFGTIPLMPAERLETARTVVRAFDLVVILLIVLAAVLVALAVWLASNRRRMVIYVAIGIFVAFVLARLFANAAVNAITTSIAQEGVRGAIDSILTATIADFRTWALVILVVTAIIGIVALAWGRTSVALSADALRDRQRLERIGIAAIVFVVAWIALGFEIALLAGALVVGLELLLPSRTGPAAT